MFSNIEAMSLFHTGCSLNPVDTVTFLPTAGQNGAAMFTVGLSLASLTDCEHQISHSWNSVSLGINKIDPFLTGTREADVEVTKYGQHEVCYYFGCVSHFDEDEEEDEVVVHHEGQCCTTISAERAWPTHLPVYCDFNTLLPGVPLTESLQADILHNDCFLSVETIVGTTTSGRAYDNPPINVFDSSAILSKYPRDDPDLGSPNRACGPIVPTTQPGSGTGTSTRRGPGRGRGGKPSTAADQASNPFSNCNELGNLLILQNADIHASEKANDSAHGGCMVFTFQAHVHLMDFGLLDIEEGATITVRTYATDKFSTSTGRKNTSSRVKVKPTTHLPLSLPFDT
jgi:hypothetical protein